MGRYRDITASLISFSNEMTRRVSVRGEAAEGVFLSAQEWQLLECIIEHDDENLIMADFWQLLSIPQSSLSKMAKRLFSEGLVEKFRLRSNQKNIILRPSEKGLRVYRLCCERYIGPLFDNLFNGLDSLSDEQLAEFTAAMDSFNEKLSGIPKRKELVKIEP